MSNTAEISELDFEAEKRGMMIEFVGLFGVSNGQRKGLEPLKRKIDGYTVSAVILCDYSRKAEWCDYNDEMRAFDGCSEWTRSGAEGCLEIPKIMIRECQVLESEREDFVGITVYFLGMRSLAVKQANGGLSSTKVRKW